MKIVFATNNKHKLHEIRKITAGKIEILSLSDIHCHEEIPETGTTLEENALLKAQFIKDTFGFDCFADDTGLEVDALDGAPGVYSSRYAGEACDPQDNMDKLLRELQGKKDRRARFRTVIALLLNGEKHLFEGEIKGRIIEERRGTAGFGYDPVFLPDGYNKTFAELGDNEKNKISHRAIATDKLVEFLLSTIIRTGIIGYGLSGRVFHAPFVDVVDGYELTKISTGRPDRIEMINKRYPLTVVVPDGQGIIGDPDIDLVIVASPNTDHFRWAKEALLAGKHVMVEKPFTVTVAEADELIELSEKQGRVLTVYHNRRFTSDTKTVKKLLNSGLLGEVRDYESHFDRYRSEPRPFGAWREKPLPGSGIFYDLGSHLIDQALWLFGMPAAVTAEINSQRPWAKADDHFDVRLHYPAFTATLKSGMICKIPGPTYMIHGTNGSYVKYGLDVQEATLDGGAVPEGKDWGREPEEIWGTINAEYKGVKIQGRLESEHGDYRDYFINLRDAILGKAEIAVKPEEARNVMKIIELAFRSSEERRTIDV